MRATLTLLLFALVAAAGASAAAPPAVSASELCVLAMKNRPLDQLADRNACALVETKALPKGSAMVQAVVARVPLDTGAVEILFLQVDDKGTTTWHDLGVFGGSTHDRGVGSDFAIHQRATLESVEVRPTPGGPVLEVASLHVRTITDKNGASDVTRHDLLWCQHKTELVCVHLPDRLALAIKGDVFDQTPFAWTRKVALDKAGKIVVGALEGTGELSPFDPGPGSHTIASLADAPFVRLHPIVPLVHPDAVKDDLELP